MAGKPDHGSGYDECVDETHCTECNDCDGEEDCIDHSVFRGFADFDGCADSILGGMGSIGFNGYLECSDCFECSGHEGFNGQREHGDFVGCEGGGGIIVTTGPGEDRVRL